MNYLDDPPQLVLNGEPGPEYQAEAEADFRAHFGRDDTQPKTTEYVTRPRQKRLIIPIVGEIDAATEGVTFNP